MQGSQTKILRAIANAPRYVTNHTLHTDFNIPYLSDVIHEIINKHHNKLEAHPNTLLESLLQSTNTRRLKRCWPLDTQRHLRWHRWMNTLPRHSNTWYRSVLCIIITLAYRLYSFWLLIFFFLWRCDPTWVMASSFLRFLEHTHNDAPQSVGLLWTSDQLVAETSTLQHTTLTTDKHPCPRWDSNPRSQQASGRRPTP